MATKLDSLMKEFATLSKKFGEKLCFNSSSSGSR
jgi:hypothetical protein